MKHVDSSTPRLVITVVAVLILISLVAIAACTKTGTGDANGNNAATNNAAGTDNSPDPPVAEQAEVLPAVKVATTTDPLTSMTEQPVNLAGTRKKKEIHLNPNVVVSLGPAKADAALQPTPSASQSAPAASGGKNISGLGNQFKGPQGNFSMMSAPPDTTGAVGDTQFVQWVNDSFAVFDKNTGNALVGPILGNQLFKPLGGHCASDNDGDPVVVFDKFAKRWVLAQFAVSSGFSQCVAVSTTSDATGTYHLYEFSYPAFDDYPKMSVWSDGYYVTFNMFNSQNKPTGSRVCAYDRAKMLSGQMANQQCFQLSPSFFGLLPADVDGATSALADASGNPNGPAAPPAGSPNYVLSLGSDNASLNLWKFHVDWNKPSKSTFGTGASHNPNATIAVTPYTLACNGSGENCVPQPGAQNPEKLDTLGERLMFRLAYRRFADHESLLASHSVDTGPPNPRTGMRWYELRNLTASAPTVFQQSTYAPDQNHRWMSSIAMDRSGNLAAGYDISSTTVFPGIRYSSRGASDPPNALGTEVILQNGSGTQRCLQPNGQCDCPVVDDNNNIVFENGKQKCDTLTRWGDYSTLSLDPTDDCVFWYTAEYGQETGAYKWHTRIGSFRLAGCS
ncbi:MAG TPA: hypothetical protein VE961_19780 [Pyrinomonadaceae bacterium]|nr:hypothetical protein [Pyrinomonadaceae bacterium]